MIFAKLWHTRQRITQQATAAAAAAAAAADATPAAASVQSFCAAVLIASPQ